MSQSVSPVPIRRRVRFQGRVGDEVRFVTKSFTRDDGTNYHPVINEASGEFACDCPDYLYRKSFCKHLKRARSQLKRGSLCTPVASPPSPPVLSAGAVSTPSDTPATTAPSALVASPPLPAPSLALSAAMPRFFAHERITQIIPAPHWLKAQFADGCADEPVLCLALLSVPAGGNAKAPYQLVMPMVAYHGALELACDVDRPYLRLSSESA